MRPDRNWIETHHEVVCAIENIRRNEEDSIRIEVDDWYKIAVYITDDFQELIRLGLNDTLINEVNSFTRRWLCKETQEALFQEMVSASGINVVTCGNCGHVVLHRSGDTELSCPDCKFTSEPCDFPDLYS